VTRYRVESSID